MFGALGEQDIELFAHATLDPHRDGGVHDHSATSRC